ncbi:hypothetical protein EGM70_18200 [Enterobacteriaceae bacterium 89]|nr:hypothetical protein [Enterobacteriaceae bacterium 89]
MKLNSRLLIAGLPIITAIACATYAAASHWQQTHFSCDSQLTLVSAKGTEEMIIHFNFSGKSGRIETRGKYVPKNGEAITTSNKVDFTFWRDGDSLVMISDETNKLPKIAPPMLDESPDFFSTRERGLRLKVIQKSAGSYLFLYEDTPGLYCTASQ